MSVYLLHGWAAWSLFLWIGKPPVLFVCCAVSPFLPSFSPHPFSFPGNHSPPLFLVSHTPPPSLLPFNGNSSFTSVKSNSQRIVECRVPKWKRGSLVGKSAKFNIFLVQMEAWASGKRGGWKDRKRTQLIQGHPTISFFFFFFLSFSGARVVGVGYYAWLRNSFLRV